MTSTKIFSFLLLLVQSVFTSAADDEYFQKAIFRTLKEKQGQFSSEMRMTRYSYGHRFQEMSTGDQEEKFSFQTNTGFYSFYGSDYFRDHNLYVNGSEFYSYSENQKDCRAHKYDRWTLFYHLGRWAPASVFYEEQRHKEFNYSVIGPNALLEYFYRKQNGGSVKCEDRKEEGAKNPKKCSISFRDFLRLDYLFVDSEEHTMIPTKIERYEKETKEGNATGEWKLASEIQYLNFTPIFSEEQIVSADLPIQKGCRRMNPEKYPRIKTDYGARFELELDVLFEHKASPSRYHRHTRPTIRSYSVKLFVDKANSIHVAETIEETTNASIRTYYDAKSRLLNSVTLENSQCRSYNLSSNESLNWFYVQEMFARRAELFQADGNYSYLREFRLDGVSTGVFEKSFSYEERFHTGKVTTRQRKNYVPTDSRVLSTHYLPIEADYWPNNPKRLAIPKRIELAIEAVYFPVRYDHLTIDVKSFNPSPKEPEKCPNISKCEDMEKKA